ncbi:peroxiredoxin [Pseudahrensia aquimaris]|uniref:thioredoxin-dependent peroxiredoxin n=1 Tax=Pseudahrensia aquimaris TaxID=744461 RepID=A0ABW3FAM9_9HYPH
MAIDVGDTAPAIELDGSGGTSISLSDMNGPTVVFFYPKDDTPGCTTEAKDFTALRSDFDAIGVNLIGISPDTVAKHDKFVAKHDLNVMLGSDEEQKVLNAYGVWVEKSMYGKTYMGVERSTFLIGADGVVKNVWRKVKVKGHAEAVLEAAKELVG